MDQETLNRNIIHALSKMNKAIMSLQAKTISLASYYESTNHLIDLTKMDMQVLDELQGQLDRLKNAVQ